MFKRGKIVSEAEFRAMWLDKTLTTTDIGKILGISQAAASQRGRTRGLPDRRKGPEPKICDDARFSYLWNAGVCVAEIAKTLGVCGRTVRTKARKLGLERRRGGKHSTTSLSDIAAIHLAARMKESARIEQAALANAEMLDGIRPGRKAA